MANKTKSLGSIKHRSETGAISSETGAISSETGAISSETGAISRPALFRLLKVKK